MFGLAIDHVTEVVGVRLAAFSPNYFVLLVARVVIGLTIGSSSMAVPLYLGEQPAAA